VKAGIAKDVTESSEVVRRMVTGKYNNWKYRSAAGGLLDKADDERRGGVAYFDRDELKNWL
jgi:Flp pilus assembly protein TadD